MNSIAQFTYPHVVWRNSQKFLWNPIHRKALKNRPEERVRLRTVEYLLAIGWSRNRISTEESVGTFGESDLRTDIICYDRQFQRKLLIECKAGQIPISARTALQTARYNQMVKAPYMLMTNGRTDYWYSIDGEGPEELPAPPEFIHAGFTPPVHDFQKWQQYGFAGEQASPVLQEWLEPILPLLWGERSFTKVLYLDFEPSPIDIPLNHYFRLRALPGDRRLALTVMGTPAGRTRLVAVLNENKQNRAVLEVDLDRLFAGSKEAANSTIYSEAGEESLNLAGRTNLKEVQTADALFRSLAELF